MRPTNSGLPAVMVLQGRSVDGTCGRRCWVLKIAAFLSPFVGEDEISCRGVCLCRPVLLALLCVTGSVLENTLAGDGCCRNCSADKIYHLPSYGKINASLPAPSLCAKCSTKCSLPSTHFRGITRLIGPFLGPSRLEYAVCTTNTNGNGSGEPTGADLA